MLYCTYVVDSDIFEYFKIASNVICISFKRDVNANRYGDIFTPVFELQYGRPTTDSTTMSAPNAKSAFATV